METEGFVGVPAGAAGDVSAPLVEAKILAPSLRRDVIERTAITQALEKGAGSRLALLEAPAGYGKSTTIRSWCATQDAAVAWVTLDSGDDDPVRMWTYIATAVERAVPGLAHPVLKRLEVPGSSVEYAADELLTMLGRRRKSVILVLDDLHTVTDHDSLATIDHALRHLPDNVHMVIGTRVDPPLAIPRMRAAQELIELRASDLAFTVDEAHTLLVEHGDLELTPDQVESLVERTLGWPAMLVLAGIWLRSFDDPTEAVSRFGGEQRFVADYLSTEVLGGLDPVRRRFLQGASVLGHFTPALCDAALDRTDSDQLIHDLERRDLFVSRLQDGDWFRIHPLFGEYALLTLEAAEPGSAKRIHRSATRWLAERWPIDAMTHASAAGDSGVLADLLAENHLSLIRQGAGRTLLRWASTLPDDVLVGHPDVAVAAAISSILMSGGALERRRYLGLVDQAVAGSAEPKDGYVAVAALIARTLALEGGVAAAVDTGRRAVALTRNTLDQLSDGALTAYARALYFAGEFDQARETALLALEHPDATRRVPSLIHAHSTLALVAVHEGRLSSAQAHCVQAKELVGRISTSRSWLGGNVVAALGALFLAEGRVVEGARELASAERLLREDVATVAHTWLLLLMARTCVRRGRLDRAAEVVGLAHDALAEIQDAGTLPALAEAVEHEIALARDRAQGGSLVAPPSDAELTVLRLMVEGLSVREIGERLFVSENTVRTHRRALYRKLGVHSRAEATARANALDLLMEPQSPG